MTKRVEMSIKMAKQVKGGVKWPEKNWNVFHTNCGGKVVNDCCSRCGCSGNLETYIASEHGATGTW